MTEQYSSPDIWLISYLLCEADAELTGVQTNVNTIQFCIRGENLATLASSYCQKEALANVAELRIKLNYLRDIIFESRKRQRR